MALNMLNEGGCSEDELLEKCIQSFGECLLPWPPFPILRWSQALTLSRPVLEGIK